MEMNANDRFDDYRLIERLGKGLGSEVWCAMGTDGIVALKIFDDSAQAEALARRECAAASLFDSEHVLRPYELHNADGRWALVLPLCEGRSVDGVAGFFSEPMMWRLVSDIASALAAIHQQGYVHGNVAPRSILWTGKDFLLGSFRCCRPVAYSSPQAAGGDFRFTAHEAAGGSGAETADVWSLGATVFYLLMGCHVFGGLGGRAQNPASPIPFMRKDKQELSLLVKRCLAYDPAERPSAADVASAAAKQLHRLSRQQTVRPRKPEAVAGQSAEADEFWPEEMTE